MPNHSVWLVSSLQGDSYAFYYLQAGGGLGFLPCLLVFLLLANVAIFPRTVYAADEQAIYSLGSDSNSATGTDGTYCSTDVHGNLVAPKWVVHDYRLNNMSDGAQFMFSDKDESGQYYVSYTFVDDEGKKYTMYPNTMYVSIPNAGGITKCENGLTYGSYGSLGISTSDPEHPDDFYIVATQNNLTLSFLSGEKGNPPAGGGTTIACAPTTGVVPSGLSSVGLAAAGVGLLGVLVRRLEFDR